MLSVVTRTVLGLALGANIALAASVEMTGAQTTDLRQLSTGDDSKGWEAVGRLDMAGRSFCTGALVAPNLVLTAAHCLYDPRSGLPFKADQLSFKAGFRNGRAEAYRGIRQGVVHPRYSYTNTDRIDRVAYDLALLELDQPIRRSDIQPFPLATRPAKGAEVGVVSYGQDRAELPSLQEVCHVLAGRAGILMLDCDVEKGSSGSPVFVVRNGVPHIASVVSSSSELNDSRVALSTSLEDNFDVLQRRLAAGEGVFRLNVPPIRRFSTAPRKDDVGAKFVRP